MRSTVRKAAKLAVYEDIMISVKNHQVPATILVDKALDRNNYYVSVHILCTYARDIMFLPIQNRTEV